MQQKALKLVLACLQHWGDSPSVPVKLEALLVLREVAKFVDNLHYEKMMKKTYLTFVENVKNVSWRNYDQVVFMVNCIVNRSYSERTLPGEA